MQEICLFREEGGAAAEVVTVAREEQEKKPEKGLFCRYCGQLITHEERAVEVGGSHAHAFFNPAGIIYEIRCFSKALGCTAQGDPTDEFTWFPGYTWCLALCGRCFSHLGWYFSSADTSFYGLIKRNLAG